MAGMMVLGQHRSVSTSLSEADVAEIRALRHDVKGKLNNIIGLASLMRRMQESSQVLDPDQREFLDMIVTAAYEINDLINETRRMTEGKAEDERLI